MRDLRSVFMPYVIQKQIDGKYVILNRLYKPLGFCKEEYVDYENYKVTICRLTSDRAQKISFNSNPSLDSIYLYNDKCIPTKSQKNMSAYLERLGLLARLTIRLKGRGYQNRERVPH